MNIIVDALAVNYTVNGTGPTMLLLHGWGDSLRTFEAQKEHFSASYTVVALDLPGFGGSQAPPDAWGLDEYAAFVAHFLQKANQRPTIIIGHSNGGAIAVTGLANEYFNTEKLVLLASSGIRAEQTIKKRLLVLGSKVFKVATFWLPKAHKTRLRKKVYDAIGSDYLQSPHLQETFKKIVSSDIRQLAEAVTAKTLLIYGKNDTATPVAHAQKLQACITDSSLQTVEAGHFLHQTDAAEVNSMIEEFIQ